MNYCINANNPVYRKELLKLTEILGDSNAAIAALELTSENIEEFFTPLQALTLEKILNQNAQRNNVNTFLYDKMISKKQDPRLLDIVKGKENVVDVWNLFNNIIYLDDYLSVLSAYLRSKGNIDNRYLNGITFVIENPDFNSAKLKYSKGPAYYNGKSNTIYINANGLFLDGNSASTIMHEILHAITVHKLKSNPQAIEVFKKFIDKYNSIYTDTFKYHYENDFFQHAIEEFIADAWTDPQLIKRLQSIKVNLKTGVSLWLRMKQFFIKLFDIDDNSLYAQVSEEIDKLLDLPITLENTDIFYKENPLNDDTRDIIALMFYLYSKEGLNQDEIKERIKAYLNNDKQEVNTVKKFVDFVQIRQAQLHTLGKDFGAESYTANGFFDWENYLKGIDLRHDITEEDDLSAFEPITDYVIEPAEIIVPKIYKSLFKLGNYDIADIDENFFKKVNPFYDCSLKPSKSPDLSQAKIDVLVRTHTSNYNVIIKDDLSAPIEGLTRVEPRIEDGWRLSLSGRRMYQVPLDLTFEIYKDKNGVETLVIKNGEGVEKSVRKLISSTENLVSVQLFLENVKPTEDWVNFAITNNNINSNNLILKQIKKRIVNNEANDDATRSDLSILYYDYRNKVRYKNDLASTLYNSFVKSLYLVSVRIPTQAFQSIMATKASALTNDDSNNVFVTRWQFWLLGSKQLKIVTRI